MNKQKAYEIASLWGSYMSSGDPGACFYGFCVNDGRPQDENHRSLCINYTKSLIFDLQDSKKLALSQAPKEPTTDLDRDIKELNKLLGWFRTCDLNKDPCHAV